MKPVNKVSAVYQIVNRVTGERYLGSSVNVKDRWADHKCPGLWKKYPNNKLYHAFQEYGIDKFEFLIIATVKPEYLKQVEQEFIELLNPVYNQKNAKGLNVERIKETRKNYHNKYSHTEKGKEIHRKSMKKYSHTEKGKEYRKNYNRKYQRQLCLYDGEELTFSTLRMRLSRKGIINPAQEAKKYLINKKGENK